MADEKISQLTADTAPTIDDLMVTVTDPAGTPANRKVTLENLFKVISGLTADTTPTTDDLVVTLGDPSGTPVVRKVTLGNLRNANRVVQVVNTQTSTVATGTTTIPTDGTIPQITEGDEYMTLAITPTSATNKLRIDIVVNLSNSAADRWQVAALFQDATVDALAAALDHQAGASTTHQIVFTHYMTAGTTSATTFRVRAGANAAGTTTFNGSSGASQLGAAMASSITITEISV